MLVARGIVNGHATHGEVEGDRFHPISGDVFASAIRSGAAVPLASVTLLSPVEPRQILVQMGGFMPKDGSPLPPGTVPWLLPKVATSLQGENAEIAVPTFVATAWAEVELAILIGRRVHAVSLAEARHAIFGYACFNDASAPEFLPPRDYWRTKSIDTFASLGPWIRTDLTEDDIRRGLHLAVRVNGTLQGEGNTSQLKFAPSEIVRFASLYTTLHPGDVISLGTPKPVEVVPGDRVELEVEGIGVLHNRIVAVA